MKVSSAYILASQAHTIPKPDPWILIPKSEWRGIYSQSNVAMKFKYKIWRWDSSLGKYVFDDVWRQYTYTNISQVKVTEDNVYGQHLWSGDTKGMVPGIFFIDADRYYQSTNTEVIFDVRTVEGNGTMLDPTTFTLAEAGASLYASGFNPGTYKMIITRYLGIPFSAYYNGQITRGLEIVNLRDTHVSYTDDDWFDLDTEIIRFDGYEGEFPTPLGYRRGLAVKMTETHIFKIDYLWQSKVFANCGIATFCDGFKEVDFDSDGERYEEGYWQTQERNVFHYMDYDLYRLK